METESQGVNLITGKCLFVCGRTTTVTKGCVDPKAERMPTADNFVVKAHNKGCLPLTLQPMAEEIAKSFVIEKDFKSSEAGVTS